MYIVETYSYNLSCPLYLSGWVAAKSVRLYVDKNYRYHYLSMLGYDPPENLSLDTASAKTKSGASDEDFSSDEAIVEKQTLVENQVFDIVKFTA